MTTPPAMAKSVRAECQCRKIRSKEYIMSDPVDLNTWWQKELQRSFTSLEYGLLGALFTAIAIILMMVLRFRVG